MSENLQPELRTKKRLNINKTTSLILALGIITLTAGVFIAIHIYSPKSSLEALSQAPETVPGKIITLKKIKPEHFLDYHNMLSNTVRKGLEWPKNITLEWSIRELRAELEAEKRGDMLLYGIFDNKDNKLIGTIDVREEDPNSPSYMGQFGVWINENYWGGGRMAEATKLIARVYFALMGKDSFVAHVRLWNQRSYHALKKSGFKDAGFFYENGEKARYVLILEKKDVI